MPARRIRFFRGFMKRIALLVITLLLGVAAVASPLGTAARTVIPSEVQQIISVDYRTLKGSGTAMALKERVLPDSLKMFEGALKGVGISPDNDVEQLTFASFRTKGKELKIIGIAQGDFQTQKVLKRLKLKKIKPEKYRTSFLYPMTGGMQMVFLDSFTMLFGEAGAVKSALDTRDGEAGSMTANNQVTDMISSVESATIWSVLDQPGTQNMMRSALGDAAKLADYEVVKKRLLGSRYTMQFNNGVNFDLDVVTSDTMTAATLSSLLKAGMLYKKVNATPVEKLALDSVTVDSESGNLKLHFKTDDKKFQSLLQSELFAAVSR
jgi:hypothetical protein